MDILKKAYQKMCTSMQGGWGAMAGALGMTVPALENHVYEKQKQCMTVHMARQLQDISGTTYFAEAVARDAGGVFVKLPSVKGLDHACLMAAFTALHSELGQFHGTYNASIDDDEIDPGERAVLEAKGHQVHRKFAELMALSFKVYCKDDGAQG